MALSNLTRAAAKALRKQRTPATAILVAAGSATRMGGIDKVMAALAGRPLLAHSMLAFQQCVQISGIIVVTRQELCSSVEEMARQYGASKLLAVVPGGATRTESVQAGLAQIPADSRLVAVHDAARPLVSQNVIYAALQAAAETGAAAPALPVKDTIKVASGGVVVASGRSFSLSRLPSALTGTFYPPPWPSPTAFGRTTAPPWSSWASASA